jgi:hypothetical protein
MNKRQKFILTSLISSLGFIGIQFIPNQYRFLSIGILGLLVVTLFVISLKDSLGKDATLLTLILPLFFTIGVGMFWFLLPTSIYTRIPVVIFYGLGIYALCLTVNIYTVAAIRTIALLRAARAVGFVLTIFTFFLNYDTLLSLRSAVYIICPSVALLSFPLFLQGFWAISLDRKISQEVFLLSLISSLVMSEIALSLFFWPVTVVVGSLFFTVAVYMLLGLGQSKIEGRLFAQTVKEYFYLGAAVLIGMFLATKWGS